MGERRQHRHLRDVAEPDDGVATDGMNASLIAAGQRAEHYEIAAYGTLVALAQAVGHSEAATLLQQTLDEEEAADKKLSALAEGGINRSAANAAHQTMPRRNPWLPPVPKPTAKTARR